MPDHVTKRCSTCREIKLVSEFGGDARRRDGLNLYCRDCKREKNRRYYRAHPEAGRENRRRYREANREVIREKDRQRYAASREKAQERKSRYADDLHATVFAHYGSVCACCSATENLTIDHVNGDGKQHRWELFGRNSGLRIYPWLIREGFPPGFQTLCRRCNISKGRGQSCIFDHGA